MTESDILLRAAIDAKAAQYPERLRVTHVVERPSATWSGAVGYVTRETLAEALPPPSARAVVCVCGPPPMVAAVCGHKGTKEDPRAQGELGGLLKNLGYADEQVFKF